MYLRCSQLKWSNKCIEMVFSIVVLYFSVYANLAQKKTTHRNVELVRVVNDSEMSRLFDERVLSVQWVTQLCNIFPKYHQVYVCNGWFCLKALEQMSLCWCCRWLTRIDQFENDRHNQLKCAKFNYFWWCCCCCYLYGVFFLST